MQVKPSAHRLVVNETVEAAVNRYFAVRVALPHYEPKDVMENQLEIELVQSENLGPLVSLLAAILANQLDLVLSK